MKKTVFLTLIVNCLSVYSLKCRTGFAISQPGSKELRYSFDNTNPQPDCAGTGDTNPINEPRGCYLSGGNVYAEYGCFTAENNPIQAGQHNYDDHIYTHVCLTENCNRSNNFKFNFILILSLLVVTFMILF